MKSSPDQHDPDWFRYPETVLHFPAGLRASIDLREVLSPADVDALSMVGLDEPFAVMTAFDPRGQNLTREENDQLAARLEERLRGTGREFLRVDACSPDGKHCECSVAVKMPRKDAVALAAEFEQVAIFWFDGAKFWIVGVLLPTDPVMLPRSS